MIEIRIHGRGGQGAVIASLILARAARKEGWEVQVFPEFGVERRGVPVTAFARMDRKPIALRTRIYLPDAVMVLDPALIQFIDVTAGLKMEGWVVLNSNHLPEHYPFASQFRVATVNAGSIAAEKGIGTKTSPIVNTAMVGAFARATGLLRFDSVAAAIEETISGTATEKNVAAAREAFDRVLLPNSVLHDALMRKEDAQYGLR